MSPSSTLVDDSTKGQSAPLWRLLQATAAAVQAVRAGRSLTAQIETVAHDLRPGVQALSFQVMRQLGRATALREKLAAKAPPPAADALLCTALALCWQESEAPYQVHTLVNQAVEAARQQRQTQAQSAFINACLRRFLRERDALVAATDTDVQAQWNHPRWWVERLQADHPATWQHLLAVAQKPAPMTLRVNRQHHSVGAYQAKLSDIGVAASPVGASGLQLDKAVPVNRLPGFDLGHASVQDAAAPINHGEFWMRVPRRGARRGICSNAVPQHKCGRWMWMPCGASALIRICSAWVFKPKCWLPMRASRKAGGMVHILTPSCSMPLAPPRASCAGIRMFGGCDGLQTAASWPGYKRNCSKHCGLC